jgi:hypothetical protein
VCDRILHQQMPSTYLGLSLGTAKPTVNEFMPFLNRIDKRMMGINKLLIYSGKLLMFFCYLDVYLKLYLRLKFLGFHNHFFA